MVKIWRDRDQDENVGFKFHFEMELIVIVEYPKPTMITSKIPDNENFPNLWRWMLKPYLNITLSFYFLSIIRNGIKSKVEINFVLCYACFKWSPKQNGWSSDFIWKEVKQPQPLSAIDMKSWEYAINHIF